MVKEVVKSKVMNKNNGSDGRLMATKIQLNLYCIIHSITRNRHKVIISKITIFLIWIISSHTGVPKEIRHYLGFCRCKKLCTKLAGRKHIYGLVDSCKHSSVNWIVAGTRCNSSPSCTSFKKNSHKVSLYRQVMEMKLKEFQPS